MYKLMRVIAFTFKFLNLILDLLQTWQFASGGTMVAMLTFIVTYFSEKPIWFVVVFSIASGILLVCIASLLFKSYALKVTERRRIKRLARLVYDIHKRVSFVRSRLVLKTDWSKVDTSKVITPLLSIFGELRVDDSKISELNSKLSESGSAPAGIASVPDAIIGKSDTSLEYALKKDFRYKLLTARLDNYKPYPSESIGNMVSKIINTSISINNAIILQSYASPDSLSLERLSELTTFTDVTRMKVFDVSVQAEKKMDDAIDKACTKLNVLLDDYLIERGLTK